jgi:uncharacterized damage-inducible protein DinB
MTTYQNLEEIYQEIDAIRDKLVARVADLTPEQAAFRPDTASWSVNDVMEHLSLAEGGICRIFEGLLAQAPAGDGFRPFSMAAVVAPRAGEKFQAPDVIAPTGQVPLADSLTRLRQSRAALHSLRPRIAAADLSETRFPHLAFGPINGYQWLAFIGLHEMRHSAQVKHILQQMKDSEMMNDSKMMNDE